VDTICSILDEIKPTSKSYKEQITFVTDRPGHDFRYAIDANKIETQLAWQADENFEYGIKKTVDWYLNKYSN
jgi:dTDP-glucose 4,6-dehydratase